MKRCWTLLNLTLAVAALLTFPACGGAKPSETTPDKADLSTVFEKDIPEVLGTVGHPEWKDKQTLIFRLSVGDIVEGEVTSSNPKGSLISTVKDPFGNMLFKSATKERHVSYYTLESGMRTDIVLESVQQYPWRFAFIAAGTGDYTLDVYKGMGASGSLSAHLRVTITQ